MLNYLYLMRLHKPIGILLLLWPTLWALWLATGGLPDLTILSIFILGVILMRSAGCVINDWADKDFDGLVERTKHRPLATKKINPNNALILFSILMTLSGSLVLFLNFFTMQLAFLGAGLAIIYPFMKRFTNLPQVGLSMAFAWGVPMAFAATENSLNLNCWIVFFATAIWIIIYDTQYAMVDLEDDKKIGVKSTAILFGENVNLILTALQFLFVILQIMIGIIFHLNWLFFLSLIMISILFIYQHHLLHTKNVDNYFKAFLNNNWVGMLIFLGIIFG